MSMMNDWVGVRVEMITDGCFQSTVEERYNSLGFVVTFDIVWSF